MAEDGMSLQFGSVNNFEMSVNSNQATHRQVFGKFNTGSVTVTQRPS